MQPSHFTQPLRHRGSRLAGWLVAALLLLAQWGALAHQIEHQTHAPHAPCVLCVSADQFGNALPVQSAGATPVAPTIDRDCTTVAPPAFRCALAFRSRAPPLLPRVV